MAKEKQLFNNCRVRYAPSPTGYLHLGNARTALFNFLFARHFNGKFIIRNEDTDQKRLVAGSFASQIDDLRWLGVIGDETPLRPGDLGPYQQSQRTKIYHSYLRKFLQLGFIYRCFCTDQELKLARQQHYQKFSDPFRYSGHCSRLLDSEITTRLNKNRPFVLRWKVKPDCNYRFSDLIRGLVTFNSSEISDWVVMKSDRTPTFNFAVAVDDMLMKITHVIRGEEHISNTPLQLMVYEALGATPPLFAHLNLIVNETGRKLSKRNCHQSFFISYYRQQGYLPVAVFNFLALLGWNPGTTKEIFSISDLIQYFNPAGWNKSSSRFDIKRLQYVSHTFMQQLPIKQYVKMVIPFLQKHYYDSFRNYSTSDIQAICLLYKPQISYAAQIVTLSAVFFNVKPTISQVAITTWTRLKTTVEQINFFSELIKMQNNWNYDEIEGLIIKFKNKFQLKGFNLYMPLRIMVSLQTHGPQLPTLMHLLGKAKVLTNLQYLIKQFKIKRIFGNEKSN